MPAALFGPALKSVWNGEIDFDTDTIKAMLTTSAYTPDLTSQYKSAVTNEVTGTGYTAGGVTLSSKTVTFTIANSWGTSRANSTAYALGALVRPATGNGYLYQAIVAGTSGASIPTYPTVVGQTLTDGGVTWVNKGRAIFALDCADPTWASATITARTLVIYKDTGTASSSPLICFDTAAADVTSTNGNFTYVVDAVGLVASFTD